MFIASAVLLPLGLWRNRTILAGNLGGFAIGAVAMGVSAYLPTYVQGVEGNSALEAGVALAAMSLGWPVASTICRARTCHRRSRGCPGAGLAR